MSLFKRLRTRFDLDSVLQKAWLTRGLLAWALLPIALLYSFFFALRRAGFRLHVFKTVVFPVPVIVVGNVVVGGAGKTPLVIALAEHFQLRGFCVGIVSRGYGRSSIETLEVKAGMPTEQVGDEPALIKAKLSVPVVVAKKRVDAVRRLMDSHPGTNMVICDDGLQHYELHRDIEIVVFDDRGVGNGWLLPAGPLREPWPQQRVKSVGLTLHTGRVPQFTGYVSSRHLAPYANTASGEKSLLASFRNKRVSAVAAIANPGAFFDMLRSEGLILRREIALPDHYAFTAGLQALDPGFDTDDAIFCTEKDAIKLFSTPCRAPENLFSIPLVFVAEPDFYRALDQLVTPLAVKMLSLVPFDDGHQIN